MILDLGIELGLAVLEVNTVVLEFLRHHLIVLLKREILVVGFRKLILKHGVFIAKIRVLLFQSHDLRSRMLFEVLHFSLEKLLFNGHSFLHESSELFRQIGLLLLFQEFRSLFISQGMDFGDVDPLGEELFHAVLGLAEL